MESLKKFTRRLVPLVAAAAALLVLVLAVGSAGASPAVAPTITAQLPANGASVPASSEALQVTFTCPSYVYEEGEEIEVDEPEEEGGEEVEPPAPIFTPPVLGGPEEYGVHFSTSPAVSAAGQLSTSGFGEA